LRDGVKGAVVEHLILKRFARIGTAMIVLTSLSGCDTIYGINSEKLVTANADDHCIINALKGTPGVRDVRTRTDVNKGWLIAGKGPVHGSLVRYFTYDIGIGYFPSLMIEDFDAGKHHVSDTMLSMNKRIPQATMAKALPIMLDAENNVSRDCGLPIDIDMPHQCDWSACAF
jgi:hypothetical protein